MDLETLEDQLDLFVQWVKEDSEAGKFTEVEFVHSLGQCAKDLEFFPKYKNVTAKIYELREKNKYRNPVPENRQLGEGEPTSKEDAKKNIDKIRSMLND